MRDGILASIDNMPTTLDPDQASCTVWDAFAQFGVGVGADGQEVCVIGLCLFQAAESFAKPAECPTQPDNTAPVPTILLPTPGTSVPVGTLVTFSGSATDDPDGDLTASMAWSSNLQGALGTGGSFSRGDLVVGTHLITASVTDTGGLTGTATVSITVQAPPYTLSVVGRKVKGKRFADLTWSGATGASVDIWRNNAKVTTTANDGSHTDQPPTKGTTFTYKVCNLGSTTACSNTATVAY